MTITTLPPAPSIADPATFEARADALIAALPLFISQANELGTTLFLTLRNYLSGLTLSTAGSSATFGVAAGQAADSTNTTLMELPSALSKTTGAWGFGNSGALDTGTIANSTIYHAYEIQRPDTGEVDACVSLSASAPTFGAHIPAAYTRYRRIGTMKTNGSAQWVGFTQKGDNFLWSSPVADVSGAAPPNTNALNLALTVPTGVQVEALIVAELAYTSAQGYSYYSSLDTTDGTAGGGGRNDQYVNSTLIDAIDNLCRRTNTSAQIRARFSTTGVLYYITTLGWIDRRGRDG